MKKKKECMTCKNLDLILLHSWYEVFKSDPEESLYIREMLRSEEKLNSPARVKLSTIHAAKGGEATNVLLILDNTKKIRDAIDKNRRQARRGTQSLVRRCYTYKTKFIYTNSKTGG